VVDTTTGRLRMGFIVRDHEGFVFAEFSRDLGLRNIFLEGDALHVVNDVKSQGQNWSRYGHIIDEIREVLNCMQSWQIDHVRKVVNSDAHVLAKTAVK
jgi:hypothetical protein